MRWLTSGRTPCVCLFAFFLYKPHIPITKFRESEYFKGDTKRRRLLAYKRKKQNKTKQNLRAANGFVSIYMHQKYCLLLGIPASSGHSHNYWLPMKSRKRLARDVHDTSATHTDFIRDVTDTGSQSKQWQLQSWSCFGDFKTSIFNTPD